MLKIHQRFFRSFILTFLAVLICSTAVTYFWIKNLYLDTIEKNISQNIDAISIVINKDSNLQEIVNKFKEKTYLRITFIDENGTVVAESHKDPELMENHLNRYEIIHAKFDGYGRIIRDSKTLGKKLLYIAKKIDIDGKIYYLRMADDINLLKDEFIKLSLQNAAIFAIFLIMVFVITYFISKRLKIETDIILEQLERITNRQHISDYISNYAQEFNNITRLLKKVSNKLDKRDKQKAKQTNKLRLANKQKDDIISAISHEFKNPIAVINGYCETLLNDKDLSPAMSDKFLKKIETNSNKMTSIIDRLRLTLKLEQGKLQGMFKECSLKKICTDIVESLDPKYASRDISINGEARINIDDTLFPIAVENLIENALKYSNDDVDIYIYENSLEIIDKGIGIKESELEKIKEKFYRVSKNGWNNSLGLGLFIVHSIVNLHNFRLRVESIPEIGSKFIIEF